MVPFIWPIMDDASLADAQAHQVSFSRFHIENLFPGDAVGQIYGFNSSIKESQQ